MSRSVIVWHLIFSFVSDYGIVLGGGRGGGDHMIYYMCGIGLFHGSIVV